MNKKYNKEKYKEENLRKIIKESFSFKEVAGKLNINSKSHTLSKYIKLYNIDCSHFKRKSHNFIDITGLKFGRLTAIERIFPNYTSFCGNTSPRWKCKCDCGNVKIFNRTALYGNTKSCGCLKKEKSPQNRKQVLDSSIRSLYRLYKNSAKRRNHIFNLSLEEFRLIIFKKCFYCGESPNAEFATSKGKSIPIFYNGIDRINSLIGYVSENCVPCCKKCNVAKSVYTQEEFYKWIKILYNNLKDKKLI